VANKTTWTQPEGGPRSRYRRSDEVLWRSTTRGLVILPPRGDPLALIGPAASIWHLLSERLGHGELSERLSARYEVPVAEVGNVIGPVLNQLVDAGAVVLDER
jgi:hypothetical protein